MDPIFIFSVLVAGLGVAWGILLIAVVLLTRGNGLGGRHRRR